MSTSVEIQQQLSQIQTPTATIGQGIEGRLINELPLNGRNPYLLAGPVLPGGRMGSAFAVRERLGDPRDPTVRNFRGAMETSASDGVFLFGAASFALCYDLRVCLALLTGYDEMKSRALHRAF